MKNLEKSLKQHFRREKKEFCLKNNPESDRVHTISIGKEINVKNQEVEQKEARKELHRYWRPDTARY